MNLRLLAHSMTASKLSSYFIAYMVSFSGIFLITSTAVTQGVSINLGYSFFHLVVLSRRNQEMGVVINWKQCIT